MNDDFVSRLQFQLREAAEREARRGRFARAAAALRWRVVSQPVVVGTALVCVLALAIVLAATRSADRDVTPPVEQAVPSGHGLKVVARSDLMTQGGVIAPGFGAVWAADPDTGEVLRVDPRTRGVVARVPVGAQPFVNAGADAVWATAAGRLLRIDPATNRVTARIPLRVGARSYVGVFPGREVMWVITAFELLRVDPDRNAIDRRIRLESESFLARGFATDGQLLYVLRGDGALLSLDAATGARVSTTRLALDGFLMSAEDGDVLLATGDGVSALDARSGRTLWREDIGAERVNEAFVADGSLWMHITDRDTNRDRLLRLNVPDGRETGSITLPEFGVGGIAPVADDVWIVSQSGRLVVVR